MCGKSTPGVAPAGAPPVAASHFTIGSTRFSSISRTISGSGVSRKKALATASAVCSSAEQWMNPSVSSDAVAYGRPGSRNQSSSGARW